MTDTGGPDRRDIEAVLFDIGGVLTTGPWEAFAHYERESDLPPGLIRRINATNPEANAWARFERGEVDVAGFAELFGAEALELGYEVDPHGILASLKGEIRAEMVEALRFCHERYKTAALTNNFVLPGQEASGGVSELFGDLFDVVIESRRVGARKPERRFYEMACEALSVRPSQAVFLDDLGINLKTARAMGMYTIKVVEPAEALAELYGVLGAAPAGWGGDRP